MADDADRASQEEEKLLAEAIRAKRPGAPAPTGRCFWCDETVGDHQRWCNTECRDQWEREANRRR